MAGCSTAENSSNSSGSTENLESFQTSFDFQPEAPVNGKLLGIIELGYSGFNSFIVTMDKEDRWSLEKAIYSESQVADGDVTLESVIAKIEQFKSEMIEFGVDGNNINLVASSSAIRDQKVVEIANKLRAMDVGLITVSAEQEGTYALYATVPRALLENAYMIDIGSGNTKVSWLESGEAKTLETFGSRYKEAGVTDQDARIGIKEAVAQVPTKNRDLCFLVGKIPFLLAKTTNNRSTRYTILESPKAYTFEKEQQQAGLNLYDALWEESTISYVFDWDSNFSIGVLMTVN